MTRETLIIPTVRMTRGKLHLIDQTLLPAEYRVIELDTVAGVCEAIYALRVRGAPALGVAGAYGLLVAVGERWRDDRWEFHSEVPDKPESSGTGIDGFPDGVTVDDIRAHLDVAADTIASTRPTAVNLGWAVRRMQKVWQRDQDDVRSLLRALLREADDIHLEDLAMCRALGRHGAELIPDGGSVLTHCNAGGLATSGYGTALGVVFAAKEAGKSLRVFADETRPLLQGARLTAWECERNGIPATVLVDGASASLLSSGAVGCVIVGADRIAANGDTANKIGTLSVAIAAKRYGVPFYVAAPSSTIDTSLPDGQSIPIEERPATEVHGFSGTVTAPGDAAAYNPAFDVTPAELITAIITESGVVRPPFNFTSPAA